MLRNSLASVLPTAVIGAVIVGIVLLALYDGESHSMKGMVSGPDGAPVAECTITIIRGGGETVTIVDQATSGTDGRFSVDVDLPEKSYWLWAIAQKRGFGLDWVRFDTERPLKLSLKRSFATCQGTVVDPEGQPIDGAVVSADGLRRHMRERVFLKGTGLFSDVSDEEGRFSIPGLPPQGRAVLRVIAEGRETVSVKTSLSGGVRNLTVPLRRDVSIVGRVVFQGRPMPEMSVKIVNEHGHCRKVTRADGDGLYTFDNVSPDPLYVAFRMREGIGASPVGPIRPQPGAKVELKDVEAHQCGCVRGTVRGPDGKTGLANCVLSVKETSSNRPSSLHRRTLTDHKGRFGMMLGPGQWVITACLPSSLTPADGVPPCKTVEVRAGQVADNVDLTVDCDPETAQTVASQLPGR
ncbi:MAG: carboxypeptidase-like regulatory domain-containing protein [Armatimonadota bacterium]